MVLLLAALFLGFAYWRFNPADVGFFPKCPFLQITGWKCAGCGAQRAVHFLLNGRLRAAFFENPLLVASIPYLLTGFLFEIFSWNQKFPAARKFLFGPKAIWVVMALILGFWVLRNF